MPKRVTKSVTITARITPALNRKLEAYAKFNKRTKSQALELILDAEIDRAIAFADAVNKGLRELDAGRGVPHDEAMRQIRAHAASHRRLKRKAA